MDFQLRSALPQDTPAILDIYRPFVEHTGVSFETEVPTQEEMATRIHHYQQTHPWLVAIRDGQCIGYAYASPHRARVAYQWVTEVSVYLAETARGQGIARALYTALLKLLAIQGYRQALAGIALPNPASIAFHTAMGFHHVGHYAQMGFKLDQWWDTVWMQKALAHHAGSPTPLRLPQDLTPQEWQTALTTPSEDLAPSP